MKTHFPYLQVLEENNTILSNLTYFILYPGMEYRSQVKWWPDKGVRPTLHEGIDFCYYLDSACKEHYVTPDFKVPVMADGRVMTICDDYLGQTVFLDHGYDCVSRFLSIYAHIVPLKDLQKGDMLVQGEVIATVADTTGRKNRMPAHLHISLMQADRRISADKFDWNLMCYGKNIELLDPLSMIIGDKIDFRTKNHWKDSYRV